MKPFQITHLSLIKIGSLIFLFLSSFTIFKKPDSLKGKTFLTYTYSQDWVDPSFRSKDTGRSFVSLNTLTDSEFVETSISYRFRKKINRDSTIIDRHRDTFKIVKGTWYNKILGGYYLHFSKDSFNSHKEIIHWYYPHAREYIIWEPFKTIFLSHTQIYVFKQYLYQGGKGVADIVYFNPKLGIIKYEDKTGIGNGIAASGSAKNIKIDENYRQYYDNLFSQK